MLCIISDWPQNGCCFSPPRSGSFYPITAVFVSSSAMSELSVYSILTLGPMSCTILGHFCLVCVRVRTCMCMCLGRTELGQGGNPSLPKEFSIHYVPSEADWKSCAIPGALVVGGRGGGGGGGGSREPG